MNDEHGVVGKRPTPKIERAHLHELAGRGGAAPRAQHRALHLHKIVNDLNDLGVGFKVLDQSIDTTTKEGRLLFSILASLAEFETELRAERTNEARIAAMERGVKFGAKPKLTENQIVEMKQKRSQGVLIKDLMSEYKLSKASVYRLMSEAA